MAARIVLAVRESQYIEPLLHYVHHSDYGDLVRISAFSRLDTFMEYMGSGEPADAVVGDPSFIEAWLVEGRSRVPWAVLSEDSRIAGGSDNLAGGAVIQKYQSLPSLLEAVLQLCEVRRPRADSALREDTMLLGVVSASGSSGKTTLALNMSKQLAAKGLSVFYLNLESIDSSGLLVQMPSPKAQGLERLLYELKARQADGSEDAAVKLELGRYVCRHEALRSDGFRPVDNFKEMLQMTQPDTLDLLNLLSTAGNYDVVVIDTGSLEEERTQAVLKRSGTLLWLLRNDEPSFYKTEKWLQHGSYAHSGWPQDIQDKSRFILNFASASGKNNPAHRGITPDNQLPYIPSWALQHHVDLCLESPPFITGVEQICREIVEPLLPGVFTGSPHE
ncbi:hypothetical protein R70723_05815 [Paenibacillus sp. FSL R7-0273]|uniref:hypothetical protein n=1 Tax=Paenibacillus sp. FSL R7-0273 TaxID=1536772 RepID=UPI0004F83F41|nr:hypothetical protein [Paenibacillus sp. FSL R7-0273]AIQ45463.1 hypothetical protein R70723_05815 [Paenibacillus sp. FSL R7-0273]OMF89162.1 hypothetical protein BK144_20365 [Paenibacillus sp. FSL R7-0273]